MDRRGQAMHIIRLRRPWQKIVGGNGPPFCIDVPEVDPPEVDPPEVDGAPASDVKQTSTYCRSFNMPPGLEPFTRVYLRVDAWQGTLESVTLNAVPLPAGPTRVEADITSLLQPHNQIAIALSGRAGQSVRLSGEVTLAIDDDR
jgi:hypothetical protein